MKKFLKLFNNYYISLILALWGTLVRIYLCFLPIVCFSNLDLALDHPGTWEKSPDILSDFCLQKYSSPFSLSTPSSPTTDSYNIIDFVKYFVANMGMFAKHGKSMHFKIYTISFSSLLKPEVYFNFWKNWFWTLTLCFSVGVLPPYLLLHSISSLPH